MLYEVGSENSKNTAYKVLIEKLDSGCSIEDTYNEIKEFCNSCRPSSPLLCVELCQIWELKKKYRDSFEILSKKPNPTEIVNFMKNKRQIKILESLMEKPFSLREIREKLKAEGYFNTLNFLRDQYVKPLKEANFIIEGGGVFRITAIGIGIYNIFRKSGIEQLPINSKGYEEKILKTLLSAPLSYDDMARIVPRRPLYRVLRRLQHKGLIIKPNISGRLYYYKTKRRPTSKLLPKEMEIFKALPKEGASVKDISEKVGFSITSVYKYLKRLKYKRHVKKEKKAVLYKLTESGKYLAKSLDVAHKII